MSGNETPKTMKQKNVLTSYLMTITPEWAKKILSEKNIGNRPLCQATVDNYAKAMLAGEWQLNGDTIRMNSRRLIDGQHRLHAVVQSGVTIQSFVVEGLADSVFPTIDRNKRRSPANTLHCMGETNSSRLAAAVQMIDKYMTGRADKSVQYNNMEVVDLVKKYPEARSSLQTGKDTKGLIPPSVLDACHYLFSQLDAELADEYVNKVIRGTGLQEGSPWYVLRERLMANSLAKAKLDRGYVMALCIKSWNAVRDGKTLRCLRYREQGQSAEQFPVIK